MFASRLQRNSSRRSLSSEITTDEDDETVQVDKTSLQIKRNLGKGKEEAEKRNVFLICSDVLFVVHVYYSSFFFAD